MTLRKITDGVFWAGAIDWSRRLFDSLIPLPDGTSYNAYLVNGEEKTALIDTVDPSKTHILMEYLEDVPTLDFIVSQHAEQDHSGAIPAVLEKYPSAELLASQRAIPLLSSHLGISEDRIHAVGDKERLSLGSKTLEFINTPWVHWPETMSTYLIEDKILFTCDLFGSHLAVSGLDEPDFSKVSEAAKRYYAEVMMPFRGQIRKHIERFAGYEVKIIAPSHGPIHFDTERIMRSHLEWISDGNADSVVIAYASMHGSTETMALRLTEALSTRGVKVELFNLAVADTGKFAMSLVDAATLVIGSPIVLTGAHPLVMGAAFMANALKPKVKNACVIGSYGWGGKMAEQITGALSGLSLDWLPPVLIKGKPTEADYKALDELAVAIEARHRRARS
ncbi:MAG: FprA family A-type flavoprotein [Deltaproteobacteria bacterium]|nr:FprA family A-type flavoprotein [Deltaproteobacteria bacterium]